ncbi:MAG TPA: hypothetical protein VE954_07755 [Oligoflexus sp.]|uniref:hypothetical protein n=1 Tax=Oligoflexus sp. TaxID=1971216 RepID=UPI002D759E42|nr:hypothetical protein [Oligoflexus sp.]HYX32995.1 hypothetical protein [Oligoflexus sp.]
MRESLEKSATVEIVGILSGALRRGIINRTIKSEANIEQLDSIRHGSADSRYFFIYR